MLSSQNDGVVATAIPITKSTEFILLPDSHDSFITCLDPMLILEFLCNSISTIDLIFSVVEIFVIKAIS